MKSLPQTMKAVALTGHGNIDMLRYGDYPLPQVAADEVLIEGSYSVSRPDHS